jgi:hypothetical protein
VGDEVDGGEAEEGVQPVLVPTVRLRLAEPPAPTSAAAARDGLGGDHSDGPHCQLTRDIATPATGGAGSSTSRAPLHALPLPSPMRPLPQTPARNEAARERDRRMLAIRRSMDSEDDENDDQAQSPIRQTLDLLASRSSTATV